VPYALSKHSSMYHYSRCDWVERIGADNLVTGGAAPDQHEATRSPDPGLVLDCEPQLAGIDKLGNALTWGAAA
jgi:hypothetical protein